ncbi:MAG TPA: nucleotidyltransferase domain-containing protein [Bacteroidia bacterium]|nr:nucleotidyltransferase domain-containing protein [Bacteroidia bacterium]
MQLSLKDKNIIKNFFSDKPILKAYLFGFYARNEAESNSDIDILVDLDYSKHIGLSFVSMKLELEKKLHKKIDLVSSQAISKTILPFVEHDKKLIYER